MVRDLRAIECELLTAREAVARLDAERRTLINFNYVFTAADYRIAVEPDDPDTFDFDDIWGDAVQSEIDDPDSKYNEWLSAYNGCGIFSFCVRLYRRDPASGEFHYYDACGGFFGVNDYPDQDTIENMMEHAKEMLPENINFADVEGAK